MNKYQGFSDKTSPDESGRVPSDQKNCNIFIIASGDAIKK